MMRMVPPGMALALVAALYAGSAQAATPVDSSGLSEMWVADSNTSTFGGSVYVNSATPLSSLTSAPTPYIKYVPFEVTPGDAPNLNFTIRTSYYPNAARNPLAVVGGISPVAAGVPEPSTWAMLLTGFGLIGGALRGRRAPKQAIAVN